MNKKSAKGVPYNPLKDIQFNGIGIAQDGEVYFIRVRYNHHCENITVMLPELKSLYSLLHVRFGKVCKCNPKTL